MSEGNNLKERIKLLEKSIEKIEKRNKKVRLISLGKLQYIEKCLLQ